MKIVVIGGTGLIGSKLVKLLRDRGQQVVSASPTSHVNTVTGDGLREVLEGTDVLVDVSNAPSFGEQAVIDFFTTSTGNLLAAAAASGVRHYVALSVVGTELLADSGYFRAKLAQEQMIQQSGLLYSIVRATQFFEFLGAIAASGENGEAVHLAPASIQPVAADDVAATLAQLCMGNPINQVAELAGPERASMCDLIQRYLRAVNDSRPVISDVQARYFGVTISDLALVPRGHSRLGKITLERWLNAQPTTPG